MTVLDDLVNRIRQDAALLPENCEGTIALDKALGQLDLLIWEARSIIDDEWRAACMASAAACTPPRSRPTLDDLINL